jgi:membrane dipeptidase
MKTPIVDAHLDMAGNVLIGRDHDVTAAEVRRTDDPSRPKCMVTLRELERGGVAVACATLFVGTATFDADGNGVYKEAPDESARKQLDVYLGWEADGKARIIRTQGDLKTHLDQWQDDGKLGVVVLIEGGDSITSPDKLGDWWDAGVRIVGPAWSGTRYCGGTRRPGGLTPMGRELIEGMREIGMILDFSHIAEQSFWDAIDVGPGRVIASHSNARAIVPGGRLIGGDRQLTDDMIRAIGDHDGVIGLVLFNGFLTPDYEASLIGSVLTKVLLGPRPGASAKNFVTLDHVRAHAEHIAGLIGWDRIGIGSDFDGGLGVDETPVELESAADVARVGEVAPPEFRDGVIGGNWLRVLSEALPT